ncbi:hypothetical protein VaNZ11_000125 [Volvox africanus]|uniref:Uncharacterized protein n=1 Tax=Volvox africanus TaxID=51714 RepID=A0ABQ5RL86_9CHLO|nr:hypothetical protein VaNZ11_000125 [Volvox africanus]
MLTGIFNLARTCFEVFYPRTLFFASTAVHLQPKVLWWRPRLLSKQQTSYCVMGSQTVVPMEVPVESNVYEAENEMQLSENGNESDVVDCEVPVFQKWDAQSVNSDIDHGVPVVDIRNNGNDTKEDNYERLMAKIPLHALLLTLGGGFASRAAVTRWDMLSLACAMSSGQRRGLSRRSGFGRDALIVPVCAMKE